MASKSGTLYLGMTNNLPRRIWEHKQGMIEGFSKKYGCAKLVYFEGYNHVTEAIIREKQVKKWRREKKEWLIRKLNPSWKDISVSKGIPRLHSLQSFRSE